VKFSWSRSGPISPGVKFGKPFTDVDRNLDPGQNPASAAPLAKELLKLPN
jgi:hypothetical protein